MTMISITLVVLLAATSILGAPHTKQPISLNFDPRIIGGKDAKPGEYPYQISYQWGLLGADQHVCGGTILSPTWILTAGHCITQVPEMGDHAIIAGITDLNVNTAEKQTIKVIKKIVHPDFGGNVGPNDLALLQLETPLKFGDLVKPIALPKAGSSPSGTVTLTGWGVIKVDPIFPITPTTLQTIDLPLLTLAECRTALDDILGGSDGDNPLDDVSNICTGPLSGGISACSGDSGGPLVQKDAIVGVVSWGVTPCGSPGCPSVYTNVASFIDFIHDNVDDL